MQQFLLKSLIFAACLSCFSLDAQQIRRSVIGSMGSTYQSNTGITLRSTVAQPPNAGTISNDQFYIRQGFQQPSACANPPSASFEYERINSSSCENTFVFSYTGAASENTAFQWDFGADATIANSTAIDPGEISFQTPGVKTIRLTVSTGNCTSTQSLDLEVEELMLSYTSSVQEVICHEDMDGSVTILAENGSAPFTINWDNGSTEFQINDLLPGDYSFTLTDAQNCQLSETIVVDGPELLAVTALAEKSTCVDMTDGSIVLDVIGGTPPYNYEWSNSFTDPNLIGITAGIYSVTVTDDNKCFQTVEVVVDAACDALEFYDIITPNGDGQNDIWMIEGIENYQNNNLQIFDRWGRLVFQTIAYSGDWDGRREDGNPLPMGAYYFILKLNDGLNTIHNGSITLIR